MKIVTTLCIFLILIFTINFAAAQDWEWTLAAKPDFDSGIFGACMLSDGNTGWAVGNDVNFGRIFRTNDGWQTWSEQTDTNVTKTSLSDVSFVNESIGWIVGQQGVILHTNDGGQQWEIQGQGVTGVNLVQISAIDANHAFACGDNGVIAFTSDGTNWSLVNTGTSNPFYGIDMYDATHGVAVGKGQTAYFTADGMNWNPATQVPNIGDKDFNAVSMIDQNNAWLVGDGFSVLALKSVFAKTSDGGKTWTIWEPSELIMENMWGIDFDASGKGVAVGDKGWVFVSADGNSWTPLPRKFANKSESAAIVGDKIWAIGGSGIINYSDDFGANWRLLPQVTANYLYKLAVADNDRTVAIGYASSLSKTEDGGFTWKSGDVVADNEISQQLWGIDFATKDIGWVAGSGGFIAKTIDGCQTWSLQGQNFTAEWLRDIVAYDENTVWIAGRKGVILKSSDGGTTWEFQADGLTTANLNGIDLIDQNRLAIAGEKSTFLYTTDGGTNWQVANHDLSGDQKINAIDIIDETHAWAVGNSGIILFSSDAGKNWTNQNSPTTVALDGVQFKDAMTGWIAGDDGLLFETIDGGTTWNPVAVGLTDQYLKSVDITEDGMVFVCGYNGNVLRYGPKKPSRVCQENQGNPINQYRLNQNYPNPFNSATNLQYSIAKSGRVKITIYNAIGQRVAMLVDEQKSPGNYSITWNADKSPDGIYFAKMTAGDFVAVKKLLFVK